MLINDKFIYKIADTPQEYEAIHALNYETFVEEIPQHEINTQKQLIDKFHHENTYIIAKDDQELVGMLALRGQRPFSLDHKIPDLDSYLPEKKKICEIRLLSIKKDYRQGTVFFGLSEKLLEVCLQQSFDYCIISGTTRQIRLYSHIGFIPFYQLVGKEGAYYQPMYLTLENLQKSLSYFFTKNLGGSNND